MNRSERDDRERRKYDLNGGPDPIRQVIVAVVLIAAFLMAVEGLIYQIAVTSLIPANASFSWPEEGPDPQYVGQSHYVAK